MLFVLLFPAGDYLLLAQTDFRFNGYFVTIPVYQKVEPSVGALFSVREDQFLEVSRLRLRPSLSLWEKGYLMLEYEVSAAYSTSSLLSQQVQPADNQHLADLTWHPIQSSHWTVTHFVDRLYFRQSADVLDVTIGRQRISWGTGRVWNPTDLFNPLNPTTFSKIEKDGVDALLAKVILGNFTDVSLVVHAKKGFRNNNAGFRFRSNIEGFDFSLMGGSFEKRIVLGGDFAGSLFDAGLRGEAIYSREKESPRTGFTSLILGIDNQFSEKWYGLAEYHFNGRGARTPGLYDLTGLLSGKILNVGRQYITLQASYLLHPLVVVLAGTTRNLNDRSGYSFLTAHYSSSDETSLTLGGQYFYGSQQTEYWYYPHAIYLKFDFFF